MVLAHIGRQGTVRTLAGECTASLGWPSGMCAVNQYSYTRHQWWRWHLLGSKGDGVQTCRRVHGVLGLSMGCVSVDVWWTSTVAFDRWWHWLGLGRKGDGVHTRRGVHGVLGLTMICVGWCAMNQRSCTLHWWWQHCCIWHQWWQWLGLGSEGDGAHTRRGVHGVLVLSMMGVSVDVW